MNWPGSANTSPHSPVVGATPAGRSLQSKHAAMGVDEASSELRARREKRPQKCCTGEREVFQISCLGAQSCSRNVAKAASDPT